MQPARDNKHKALEITMRDVMDNLEDAASYAALNCLPSGLEILSIEPAPAKQDAPALNQRATVLLFANV